MIDIPTSVSLREQAVLRYYARERDVLEMGALLGASTIVMAQVADHVISIDKHSGYNPRGSTYRSYMSNIHRYGLVDKVWPQQRCVLGLQHPFIVMDPQVFAFVDLTGGYRITQHALKLVRAFPLIAIHDITRAYCNGAMQALEESGRPTIEHVDTLVVLGSR